MYLILSNPPHGEVDAQAVASLFGFTPAEARMRTHFPAPQIWFADDDLGELKKKGSELLQAGVRVRIVNGMTLKSIPSPNHITRLATEGGTMIADGPSGTIRVPAGGAATIVRFESHATEHGRSDRGGPDLRIGVPDTSTTIRALGRDDALMKMQDDREHPSLLDVFVFDKPALHRLTVVADRMDCSALELDAGPAAEAKRDALLAYIERFFTSAQRDDRLVDAPAPKPAMVSGRGLRAILEAIDPALRDIEMTDLQARLVFLSHL